MAAYHHPQASDSSQELFEELFGGGDSDVSPGAIATPSVSSGFSLSLALINPESSSPVESKSLSSDENPAVNASALFCR